jgi:hypothetical protein
MGVLDEAIRDHLELRRRAGASDAELARAEAEALGPARRDPAADIFADERPAAAAETTVLDPVQAEESGRASEGEPPPVDTGIDHEAQTAIYDVDDDELSPPPPMREVESDVPVEEPEVEEPSVEGPPIDQGQPVDAEVVEEEPAPDDEPPAEPPSPPGASEPPPASEPFVASEPPALEPEPPAPGPPSGEPPPTEPHRIPELHPEDRE